MHHISFSGIELNFLDIDLQTQLVIELVNQRNTNEWKSKKLENLRETALQEDLQSYLYDAMFLRPMKMTLVAFSKVDHYCTELIHMSIQNCMLIKVMTETSVLLEKPFDLVEHTFLRVNMIIFL